MNPPGGCCEERASQVHGMRLRSSFSCLGSFLLAAIGCRSAPACCSSCRFRGCASWWCSIAVPFFPAVLQYTSLHNSKRKLDALNRLFLLVPTVAVTSNFGGNAHVLRLMMAVDGWLTHITRFTSRKMVPLLVSGGAASRLARVHGSLGSADDAVCGSGSHTPHGISLPVAVLSKQSSDVTAGTSRPVDGSTASGQRVEHGQILSSRDPDTDIGLDLDSLRVLGTFDGSIVQVPGVLSENQPVGPTFTRTVRGHASAANNSCSHPIRVQQVHNPARPDVLPHLARATALQPHSLLPGARQCVHLPPLLAFNLGLSYQLAPFIHSSPSAASGNELQASAVSLQGCSVALQPWRSPWDHAGTTAAKPQLAELVTLACVRVPSDDLLQLSGDGRHADDQDGSDDGAGRAQHAEQAGAHKGSPQREAEQEGEMQAAAADAIVEALRSYLAQMPR